MGHPPRLFGYPPWLFGHPPRLFGYPPWLFGHSPRLFGYSPRLFGYPPTPADQPKNSFTRKAINYGAVRLISVKILAIAALSLLASKISLQIIRQVLLPQRSDETE
jgi:hypothetical protein